MSNKKPFSHPRWNDPPVAKVVGKVEVSEKEQEENKEEFRKHLKKIGVLKDDD